ncbi:rhomboid family intramembrane serine protease [Ferruginibacter sp. SUN106]|uniref:rhomboid family intramembrane serine protease n=1 Tax=Ferruginibacter sp. SUN106 TaxID=2978348 RepID=UPI003D35D895
MPKYEQTIALINTEKETAFAIAYQAMINLNWLPQYAGPDKLLGTTPKNWKTNPLQVIVTILDDSLTVSSEMVSGESFDMGGKNKKTTAAFLTAFEAATKTTNESTIENNKSAINILRAATIKTAEQEAQQAAEIDAAMNLSGSNLYVTYAIMAINVVVFILMAINGAGIFEANGLVHVKWGSNYTPLTLSGDWWRLITNVFIHFGIIHLAMNMYCLYMVGVYLEPMLGKVKYTVAYLCTGVLASLVSLWWHKEGVNSAGASGAIFGMYGLFLALLTTNLIPKQMRQPLLQSIGIFVVYNLVYGMKGGVDNSAHVGGLVSGFVIGYIYVLGIKKEKEGQKLQWIVPVIALLTAGAAYGYLNQNVVSTEQRRVELDVVKGASFKDTDLYQEKLSQFDVLHKQAIDISNDSTATTDEERLNKLIQAKPIWNKAEALITEANSLDISEANHKKAAKLLEYIQLRKIENDLLSILNKEGNQSEQEDANKKLKENSDRIYVVLDELKQL